MISPSVAPLTPLTPGTDVQSVHALASARAAWDESRHRTQTAEAAGDAEDPCPTGAEEREAAHAIYAILSLLGVLAVFLLDTSVAQGRNPLTVPMLVIFIGAISLYYATAADITGFLPVTPAAVLGTRGFTKCHSPVPALKPLAASGAGDGGNDVDEDALERGGSPLHSHRLLCPLLPPAVRASLLAHPRLRSQLLELRQCWAHAETRAATLARFATPALCVAATAVPADGAPGDGAAGAAASATPAEGASPDCPFSLLSLLWVATATPSELAALSAHALTADDQRPTARGCVPAAPLLPPPPLLPQYQPSTPPSLRQFASALLVSHPRWCGPCRALRPPLSKHCHKCGRCAGRADHHCPFMGVCVTGRNHLHFLLFLAAQVTVTVFALSVLWASLPTLVPAESTAGSDAVARAAAGAVDAAAVDSDALTVSTGAAAGSSRVPMRNFVAILRPIYAARALLLSLWTALSNLVTSPDSVSAQWLLHAAATVFLALAALVAVPLAGFHAVLAATGGATYTVALGHRRARKRRALRAASGARGNAGAGSEADSPAGDIVALSPSDGVTTSNASTESDASGARVTGGPAEAVPPPLFGDDKEGFIFEDPFAELALALAETGALPIVTAHAAAAGAAAARRRSRARWLSLIHPLPRAALGKALALCGWAGGEQGGVEDAAAASVSAGAWLDWQLRDLWSQHTVARALKLAATSEPGKSAHVAARLLAAADADVTAEAEDPDTGADTDQLLLPGAVPNRAFPSAHGSGVSGRVRACTRRIFRALRRLRLRCGNRCALVGRSCHSTGAAACRASAAGAVVDSLAAFWNDVAAFILGFDDRAWLYVPLALLSDELPDAA